MGKKSALKRDGYLRVTALRDIAKDGKAYTPDRKKPPQLTTVELLHKLCSRGPGGCNEHCDSFDVCLFGQEANKRGLKGR